MTIDETPGEETLDEYTDKIEFTTPIEVLIDEYEQEWGARPAVATAPLVPAPYGDPVPLDLAAQRREERKVIWGWIGVGIGGVLFIECLALTIWGAVL